MLFLFLKVLFAREDMTSSFDSVLHTQQASLLAVICSGGKDGVSSKHFILYSNDSSLHAKVCYFFYKRLIVSFIAKKE